MALGKQAVGNWARNKTAQQAKQVAGTSKPKVAKDPAKPGKMSINLQIDHDPGDEDEQDQQVGDNPGAKQDLPSTEPNDPANMDGPDDEDDLSEEDQAAAMIEAKLGPLAEVLEVRAAELEELAGEVDGDLTADEIDLQTAHDAQVNFPEELRSDAVQHLSAMSDEEIDAFAQHLADEELIEDPDLVAGYLRAIAMPTTGILVDRDEHAVKPPKKAKE